MTKSKEFEGLLRSEIKKAEKAANVKTNSNDCKVTALSWMETHPFNFHLEATFVECNIETCHGYNEFAATVKMTIPMFDRRRSYVNDVIC